MQHMEKMEKELVVKKCRLLDGPDYGYVVRGESMVAISNEDRLERSLGHSVIKLLKAMFSDMEDEDGMMFKPGRALKLTVTVEKCSDSELLYVLYVT